MTPAQIRFHQIIANLLAFAASAATTYCVAMAVFGAVYTLIGTFAALMLAVTVSTVAGTAAGHGAACVYAYAVNNAPEIKRTVSGWAAALKSKLITA